MGEDAPKVLVIGLDGVPLELIQGWANAGVLPALKQFMTDGATGHLASTMPPTSGPSWSTFMTGKNPGKTGIFDFLYRRDGDYIFPPVNTTRRDGKAIWKIISDSGKVAGSLNVPIAYPVDKINGPMVSGWMTPYGAKDYYHPPELIAALEAQVGKYHIYPTETFAEGHADAFMRASDALLEGLTHSALYLLDRYNPDFFIVVNFDTDRILHQMWHYLDPTHPWRRDSADRSAPVREYFQKVDASIARILAHVDPETLVIILSDHGMGAAHNFIVLNNWLLQTGLLKLKTDLPTQAKKLLFDRGFTLRNVHRIANALGLAKHAEYKLGYFTDALMKYFFLSFRNVDWLNSKAYSFGRHVGSIYLNVKGREPRGAVAPGAEYERVRDEIVELAKDFRARAGLARAAFGGRARSGLAAERTNRHLLWPCRFRLQ
ncbi:MAG: alkaline phosphatase family protein [Chloroflexi bacterium]|nr:alkaline phosphatase family protein [Chloroflexota bacterium]